ncbi:MAG TPA: hypothetical protein VH743_09495 [Beijerinckiaceae bacterium]|jgi:hypothetical protein
MLRLVVDARWCRALVAVALGNTLLAVPTASAQDGSRPLTLNVRPSGIEEETEEEKLDRRLRQREYMFRSICIHCSSADRNASRAPFHPLDALAPARRVGQD